MRCISILAIDLSEKEINNVKREALRRFRDTVIVWQEWHEESFIIDMITTKESYAIDNPFYTYVEEDKIYDYLLKNNHILVAYKTKNNENTLTVKTVKHYIEEIKKESNDDNSIYEEN
jgi:hypothetical protein